MSPSESREPSVVELRERLVEHEQPRVASPGRRRAASRCRSPPDSVATARPPRCADPGPFERLADAAAHHRGRRADVLEPERDVALHARIHGLQTRDPERRIPPSWRGLASAWRARRDRTPSPRPSTVPPWKWGTSPLNTRSSDDLPDPDAPAMSVMPLSTSRSTPSMLGTPAFGYQYRKPDSTAIPAPVIAATPEPGAASAKQQSTPGDADGGPRHIGERIPVGDGAGHAESDEQHGGGRRHNRDEQILPAPDLLAVVRAHA